jgi:hypothetical protein
VNLPSAILVTLFGIVMLPRSVFAKEFLPIVSRALSASKLTLVREEHSIKAPGSGGGGGGGKGEIGSTEHGWNGKGVVHVR